MTMKAADDDDTESLYDAFQWVADLDNGPPCALLLAAVPPAAGREDGEGHRRDLRHYAAPTEPDLPPRQQLPRGLPRGGRDRRAQGANAEGEAKRSQQKAKSEAEEEDQDPAQPTQSNN